MHDDANARSIPPTHHNAFSSDDIIEEKNAAANEEKDESEAVHPRSDGPRSRADRVNCAYFLSLTFNKNKMGSAWKHDMFDERQQAPKSSQYLVSFLEIQPINYKLPRSIIKGPSIWS
jgi:hypothetical protein